MGTSTNAYLYYGFDILDREGGIDLLEEQEKFEDMHEYEILSKLGKETTAKVEIDAHCHHEYPILFVSTKTYTAWRGESTSIDSFEIDPSWDEEIRKFCEQWNIPFQQPKWRLASYWG